MSSSPHEGGFDCQVRGRIFLFRGIFVSMAYPRRFSQTDHLFLAAEILNPRGGLQSTCTPRWSFFAILCASRPGSDNDRRGHSFPLSSLIYHLHFFLLSIHRSTRIDPRFDRWSKTKVILHKRNKPMQIVLAAV